MVKKEIRVYIEGGGNTKNTKAPMREGFSEFLQELVQRARSQKIKWQIIICGSRNNAFRDFKNALKSHPDAFNLLLVDAEGPVKEQSPWKHLQLRDNWDKPCVDDIYCHLMVQAMEAWFIADVDALKIFYGQGFKENTIPKNQNVETLSKNILELSLKAATSNTSKGEYQKIKHASKLLAILNVAKVRSASGFCDRFFQTVVQIMES